MKRRDSIAARLRMALDVDLAALVAREGVDMSPRAITLRLKEAGEMSGLCFELARIAVRARG